MARGAGWFVGVGRLVVFLVAVGFTVGAAAPRLQDRPPPIHLVVDDVHRYVRPTFTYGDAERRYRLDPTAGHLLDVDGLVLERGAYPGHVEVNGGPPPTPLTTLADGDVIEVIHGQDRTEPTTQETLSFPGGRPANPQFILASQPGDQTTTVGVISGKIVSVVFRPTGDQQIPPAVALTFDDGPHPTYTPQVLAVLRRKRVPATFFVVGYLAEQYPDLIRQEASLGRVASHTYGHPQTPPFRDIERKPLLLEIERGAEALTNLGVTPTLFRPPGGSYDDQVMTMALRHGMRLVMWSVDPEDWSEDRTQKQIVRAVVRGVRPGSIVLLHDGGGDQSATVAALPIIIKKIRRMGLRFALIPNE